MTLTSVTPESIFSLSDSCSWVVVQGLQKVSAMILQSNKRVCDSLNSQCLCIANVGQVGDELESIDNLTAALGTALDAKAENTSKAPLEILLGELVRVVALQAWIGDPVDVRTVLEVLCQSQRVLAMTFGAQAQGLDAEEQLLGGERVEGGAKVTQDLYTSTGNEGGLTDGLPELEAMITVRWFNHLREAVAVLAPVERACVDNDTANGSSVAANPLGGRMDDNVGTVVNGPNEVATSTKRVVNLHIGD